jgi:hypothetical protein
LAKLFITHVSLFVTDLLTNTEEQHFVGDQFGLKLIHTFLDVQFFTFKTVAEESFGVIKLSDELLNFFD